MSNHDTLSDAIRDAHTSLDETDGVPLQSRRKQPRKGARAIIALVAFLVILAGVKYFLIDDLKRVVDEDFQASALEVFMEADASVVIYHSNTGRLPEELPAAILQPLVTYERISEKEYQLTLTLEGHEGSLHRNIDSVLQIEEVRKLVGDS